MRRFFPTLAVIALLALSVFWGCSSNMNSPYHPVPTPVVTRPIFGGITSLASLERSTVALSWIQGSDAVTPPARLKYLVYVSTSAPVLVDKNLVQTLIGTTSAIVAGLDGDTTYYFTVRCSNEGGVTDTNEVVVSHYIAPGPSAPRIYLNPTPAALGTSEITLTGITTTQSAAITTIETRIDQGAWQAIADIVPSTSVAFSVSFTGLDDAVHTVEARASNSFNQTTPFSGYASRSFEISALNPRVLSVSPVAGEIEVPANYRVTVRFSKPLDPTTITTFELHLANKTTGDPITATLRYAVGGVLATLEPSSLGSVDLATYEAALEAGITDNFGHPLDGVPLSWDYQYHRVWVPQNAGTTNWIAGVSVLNSLEVWTAGEAGIVLHTTDGGNHWITSSPTTEDINGIVFANQNVGWFITVGGSIYFTNNGGSTWTVQLPGDPNGGLFCVGVFDQNHAYAAGNNVVYVTTNEGSSWQETFQSAGYPHSSFYDAFIPFDRTAVFAGENMTTDPRTAEVLVTSNNGTSWSVLDFNAYPEINRSLHSIALTSMNDAYVVGNHVTGSTLDYAFVGRSTDGAHTWTSQQFSGSYLSFITFTDTSHGWLFGQGIYATTNSGTDWVAMPSGVGSAILKAQMKSATCGWAVGENGQVYKFVP